LWAKGDKEVAVPSLRRRASVTDTDPVEDPTKKPADAQDALTLAEQAEAEAAEAEATAAAARARTRAIRLRREAQDAAAESEVGSASGPADTVDDETAENKAAAETVIAEESDVIGDELGQASDLGQAADEESAPSGRRWGLILKVVAMTLAVLCTIALSAVSYILVKEHREVVDEQKLSAEYAAAGRQSVVTLMSLDFNKAKENVQQIIDNSTGQFKTDFQDQAEDFIKVAQESKVVTDVTVNATAVDKMSPDSAVVLVAATSRVTNAAGAKQEPRAWRLSVNLERDGGQVKMSKVEFVP
jgi:Mce-associated membrane protein